MASTDSCPQSRAGADKLEASEVRAGSGMSGYVSCLKRILRNGGYPHSTG